MAAQPTGGSDEFARFELLASAIAGRPVAVLGGAGERSYTDGESIFVANLDGPLLVASVSAQAALLSAASLDPKVMARIAGRRGLRLRYLTLEAQRGAALLAGALPVWLERMLAELYEGGVDRFAA